ncbi:sigma-54 dependent transcriptional regulator [Cellvibrio sp. NN19]|uniref:sigma-54-dependent transcriptional regulator n=1 Tax=Cellvibrio chitinivorans TaxID=3102792 RepID=UPI002B414509|nr:sigma-54 dependent transcriptional regulator [Cellvibrio sp. NN19]
MANVLLVDDDKRFLDATVQLLSLLGHKVAAAESVSHARELIANNTYTHVILDLILPDGSGLHLLEAIPAKETTKITLITGHPSVKTIVKNLYGSNISYLIKPIDLQQLEAIFTEKKLTAVKSSSAISVHFNCLVGESAPMQHLYEMIDRVATTKANVMLLGESGVGKEMVASAIHYASNVEGDYVAANCGAFSRELINSELFGHEKGAFTGATHRKIGVFEQANKGTLFLDEITEMPIDLQPNLLRVLETQKVVRLGSTTGVDIEGRVVSATNRTEQEIATQNCLREDLYFRLAVFPIHVPPLRARKSDIPLLVHYFLETFNEEYGADIAVDDATMKRLMDYDWPGNVRELRHAIHRSYIMADQQKKILVLPENLSSPFSKIAQNSQAGIRVGKTVEEVERELIESTLEHFEGDKKQAADILGISLKTLYNRLNSYGNVEL